MKLLKKIFTKAEQPMNSYQNFWKWFQKNERTFYNAVKKHSSIEEDFFEKLSPKLAEIKDGFFFLVGMFNDETAELILTADGHVKNIVFIEELIAEAPKIKGWKFTALKSASDAEDSGIRMADYEFNKDCLFFYANDHKDFPDEIDLTVVHPKLNDENEDLITNGVSIFLDIFLGELNFVTTIDNLKVINKKKAEKELIPIEKLKSFLNWRQKEFIEKYEGIRYDTENDKYSLFEAGLKNGKPLVAVINTDLLKWDKKASHPWILRIELKYDGSKNNGFPDKETGDFLHLFEDQIIEYFKDSEGYLNIGRHTANNIRTIFFACKDFRKPSKILHELEKEHLNQTEITFAIYKDKYWQSFRYFERP